MSEFESFYRKNVSLVHALMRSRARDSGEAEDLTQEAFLRAWRSFHDLAGLEAAAQRAWLVRTARNLSIDAWRRRKWEATSAPEVIFSASDEGASGLRLDVAQALAELKDDDRELVMMRYVEEMNSREIGEALGMPEGTVRGRLARCREALAERLSQWAPEGGTR